MRALVSLLMDNWRLCHLYFFSEERIYARCMLLILIILEMITVGLAVLLTYWNKAFINTLESYDQSVFVRLLVYFGFLATGIIIVSVYKIYFTQSFQLRWRHWLTNIFLNKYLSHHAYYHMSFLKNNEQIINDPNDNPDQRITIDINSYIENVCTLAIGLLNACASLISYTIILWSLSGVISINITENWSFQIHGMMVWAALIYAGLGTLITNLIGRVLFRLKYEQEHCEANFRYDLIRVREHAESIAFYRSEAKEYTSLSALYDELVLNFRQIICRKLSLNWFVSFYKMTALVFPYLAAYKRYFSKTITLGDLIQIAVAFENVHKCLSFIPSSYETIMQWRPATQRLIEFECTLDELNTDKENSQIKFIYVPQQSFIRIQQLTVRLPLKIGEEEGQILIKTLNLVLEPHRAVLITGNSGSGKSTFLRTLAGIWRHGYGTIMFPPDDAIAFLPQKAYCPRGSLRQCMTYPSTSSSPQDDMKMKHLLNLCRMNHWFNRLDEVQDWSRVLSLGEQQMMAFIRILYLRPKWLFLDEATSSLDEEAEIYLYSILFQELANHSTIISVGHRNNLKEFHQIELILHNRHLTAMPILSKNKFETAIF